MCGPTTDSHVVRNQPVTRVAHIVLSPFVIMPFKELFFALLIFSPWKSSDFTGITSNLCFTEYSLSAKRVVGLIMVFCMASKYSSDWSNVSNSCMRSYVCGYFAIKNDSLSIISM